MTPDPDPRRTRFETKANPNGKIQHCRRASPGSALATGDLRERWQVVARNVGCDDLAEPGEREAGGEGCPDEERRLLAGEALHLANQRAEIIVAERRGEARQFGRATFDRAGDPILLALELFAGLVDGAGETLDLIGQSGFWRFGGGAGQPPSRSCAAASARFIRPL